MNYRPITDTWILARPKVKYYGAYPAGFLHRARALLGVGAAGAVLHVCAGQVRQYPYRGLGRNDRTLDLDPETKPDFLRDAREPFPPRGLSPFFSANPELVSVLGPNQKPELWDAVLIDRPYTPEDAAKYAPGADSLPNVNLLVKHGIAAVQVGGKVGVLDYVWPQPPKNAVEVALVGVGCGRNQRARWFCVFERLT